MNLDSSGSVDYNHLESLLNKSNEKKLVSLMYVNNEIGNLLNVEKVSKDINSGLVSSLVSLKEQLANLLDQMNTSDLPEGVAKFLKEVRSPYSTTTLQLLTPTVLEWLTKQDLLSTYKISR